MTLGAILFYLVGAAVLASAVGMVLSRNVVRAVVLMVANFALTGALFLLLHAPFLAVVQVVVYAGAIMVLFLFVVMILGDRESDLGEPLAGHRGVALPVLLTLAAALVVVALQGVPAAATRPVDASAAAALPAAFGSPGAIADALFRHHLLAFEVVSVLLLVAMVGAVVIARFRGERDGDATEGGDG